MLVQEIAERLNAAEATFSNYCLSLTDEHFFFQPSGKWSAAQQVKHLIISADKTRPAFAYPKFIVRLMTGKPNRPSRTYDELVAKYKLKLQQGGRAPAQFAPAPVLPAYGKEKLVADFRKSMQKLSNAIRVNWKDPQLDQYIAPHPLLGKITLRELGYFTILHTYHHLDSIKNRLRG